MATAFKPARVSGGRYGCFQIDAEFDPPRMTLALRGELDLAAAPSLEREVDSLAWARLTELVLDLRDLSFIDSMGLSVLIMASQRAATAGVQFSVIRVPDQARKVFAITQMTERLNVVPES